MPTQRAQVLRAHGACVAAILMVLAMGCGEDTVHVRLQIPPAFEARAASVTLDVLVPPALAPFTCDDIAFHEVTEETLVASRIRQVAGAVDRVVALDGIPRAGTKLFFARVFDEDGAYLVAACTALGDVDGSVDVALVGEPTARVTVEDAPVGVGFRDPLEVSASDHNEQPLVGVAVKWQVVGPGGETAPGEATTDAIGKTMVTPGVVALPGPIALDVRVRWSISGVETRLGFNSPTMMFSGSLPGQADQRGRVATELLYAVGRIGPQGQKGFMALGPAATTGFARDLLIVYYDPTAGPSKFRSLPPVAVPALNAVTLGSYRTADRDHVVIISGERWLEVNPDGTFIERAGTGKAARRIVSIGPCEGTGEDLLLALLGNLGDESFAVFTPMGVQVANPFATAAPTDRLVASGCVAGATGVHRTVVFGSPGGEQSIVANMDQVRTGSWATFQTGIGFSPAVGASPPYLLGIEVDLEGAALSRFQLVSVEPDGVRPVPVTSDPSATLVRSSGGGDVDMDNALDIVALLDFGANDEGRTQFRIMFSLGVEHLGGRLVGLSREEEGDEPRIFVEDFDGDGYSDVLVATQTEFKILDMGPRE